MPTRLNVVLHRLVRVLRKSGLAGVIILFAASSQGRRSQIGKECIMEPITASDVRDLVAQRLGVRLGPEMSEYVRRRLEGAAMPSVTAIGGHARTGVRISVEVPAETLTSM